MAIFCNGKKAVCLELYCSKACPHHDGTGGYYVQTIIEKIKCTSEEQWAEVFLKLSQMLYDRNFDLTTLFCDGKANCIDGDGEIYCNDERRLECIKRWLNTPVPEEWNGKENQA